MSNANFIRNYKIKEKQLKCKDKTGQNA